MTSVHTPSRLHFGLFALAGEDRAFGGVGLMVQAPGIHLHLAPAPNWQATGPLAERALAFAHTYVASVRADYPDRPLPCQHLLIDSAAPEHAGLGTGTQLGLATARALALAWGLNEPVAVLARRVGRGRRSALGVHGFERGGLLVEAGKRSAEDLSPLVAHAEFPEDWRVVLVLPLREIGLHGASEREAFAQLAQRPPNMRQTEALCRLVLLGMLPALAERDLPTFGAALYDFNARSGEWFAPIQGGLYASPAVAEVVAFVRSVGVTGVGQSSWGPTVFAVVESAERAADLSGRLRQRFDLTAAEIIVTKAAPTELVKP